MDDDDDDDDHFDFWQLDLSPDEENDLDDFADPGGNSALRAASEDNPRNLVLSYM